MQRFKAALTCGAYDKNNPEDLVRDQNGEYVKYSDVQILLSTAMEWNWLESDYGNIPKSFRDKIESIAYGTQQVNPADSQKNGVMPRRCVKRDLLPK